MYEFHLIKDVMQIKMVVLIFGIVCENVRILLFISTYVHSRWVVGVRYYNKYLNLNNFTYSYIKQSTTKSVNIMVLWLRNGEFIELQLIYCDCVSSSLILYVYAVISYYKPVCCNNNILFSQRNYIVEKIYIISIIQDCPCPFLFFYC